MVRQKNKKRFAESEEDPMAGTANLVDAMLVIAVGLLIFVVISWNMQSVVFQDSTQQQQKAIENSPDVTEVSEGQQLNETPDSSNSSGQGYMEMGKVYKDPSTGKLIMVEG
ncbi:MAG: DUF2149 domain-containing protein [Methanobrevibacter sp.]|uniref:DUF2149 domain-containing protein n=1 Tax=uncultured Methanobrevibacter sp. TaxID=253161 RepID=UPI0025E3D0D6|nr:DUF2149 domain-containing protein [uncultured Methanobrevibacter sp.]MEE1129364.1 DUF2149 domain-containing protein [Methanobrevibacter sp.]